MSAVNRNHSSLAKPHLLLLDRFTEATESRFDSAFVVHRGYADGFALDGVAEAVRAIATSGTKGASNQLVDGLSALEIVSIRGVGTDGVDLDRARDRGIVVTTTPGLLTEDVADLAMSLLLASARRVCQADRFVRDGGWLRGGGIPLGRKVTGMRIGIVGLGRVGRCIAQRADAFGARVSYTDIAAFNDVAYPFFPNVLQLAENCGVLVLAASGGPQSLRIVDRAVLDALGPAGLLVNVARGSLIDEPALVEALVHGRLGGAGLDVFTDEPNVPPALLNLDNVVLQPHRASATVETRLAMETMVFDALSAHFAGEPVVGVV